MTPEGPDHPLVTIITPTYNHEDYIGECIESVLAQTYEHWEQVIVDDGSTDRTAEVVRSYDDPRIRLVTQENRGLMRLAETYNDVVASTDGPLLAILEGDDFWPAGKLDLLVDAMRDPAIGLAYGKTQLVTASAEPTSRFIPGDHVDDYRGALENRPVGAAAAAMADPGVFTFTFPCSVLIRRTALESIGGFQSVEGLPFTDYPTFLELSLRYEFAYVDEITGYWRQLGGSGTRVRDELDTLRRINDLVDTRFGQMRSETAMALPTAADLASARADRRVKARFDMGRRHALHGRWSDARRDYAAAVLMREGRSTKFRVAAGAGWVLSLVGQDIEPIIGRFVNRDRDLRHLYN